MKSEINSSAKNAIQQILINSRMCAIGRRPICQDTGIATVFLKIRMNVQWDAILSIQDMVNEGARQAYSNVNNKLRASVVTDIHMEIVPGNKVGIICAAKGGG